MERIFSKTLKILLIALGVVLVLSCTSKIFAYDLFPTFEASRGSEKYETLQDAINSVPKNNQVYEIELLKDGQYNNKTIIIYSNQNIILNLNGHTVTFEAKKEKVGSVLIMNNGKLSLKGEGMIQTINFQKPIVNKNILEINGNIRIGKYQNGEVPNGFLIYNDGTLRIFNGILMNGVYNSKYMEVTGGTISSDSGIAIYNRADLSLEKCRVNNKRSDIPAINNVTINSLISIYGGTEITSNCEYIIENHGKITINDNDKIDILKINNYENAEVDVPGEIVLPQGFDIGAFLSMIKKVQLTLFKLLGSIF